MASVNPVALRATTGTFLTLSLSILHSPHPQLSPQQILVAYLVVQPKPSLLKSMLCLTGVQEGAQCIT